MKISLFLVSFLVLLPLSLQDPIPEGSSLSPSRTTTSSKPPAASPFSSTAHAKSRLPPDNYLATYSNKVTGRITHGQIAELRGIRVRAFYQWWSITGIRSSGDNLVFEVGVVTAKYPSKNFDESLDCEGQRASS
ncbi:hypothetical protein HID58_088673 [Brassica napus]|uniref:BnaC09g38090D protein n=2 Tax=Brassica napus TaxID=3708 RepID=A0A078J6S1_BRANA|nr:hypothetical protein HID58_088673 [Brassica napus]CAF1777777.1 unnamed protein product [Brassica napus]CDY58966.1 BnaC09g38090D [Brassica napus]